MHDVERPRVRWRLADPALPAPYRRWQAVEVKDRLTRIQPPLALAAVEVEWFDPAAETHGAWRQAALLRLTRGSARFRLVAKIDLHLPEGFTAVAPVPPFGVASFKFPAVSLDAGAEAEITARQDGLSLANLLLEPLVFRPADPSMDLVNLTPVLAGWEAVPDTPVVLTRNADSPANYFARTGERLVIPTPA